MEISTDILVSVGTLLSSLGASWGVSQWRHNQQDKENGQLWKELGKLRDAHAAHEKEANAERLQIHEQLTEIKVAGAKTDEKFNAIMSILDDIKKDLSKLRGDDA